MNEVHSPSNELGTNCIHNKAEQHVKGEVCVDLTKKPFYLTDEDVKWVNDTYEAMTEEEKIGQLFAPIALSTDEEYLTQLVTTFHIGGTLFRPGESKEVQQAHRVLQENSNIPLLLAANLESGGTGIATDGTHVGNQMAISATNHPKRAYDLGEVSAMEGSAVGVNWAFAPVVDIDYNNYNPITNVRTYGSSVQQVIDFSSEYVQAVQKHGVAASIKHFPGDGVDDRDQHLVTSVNTLTTEEWDESFGRVYQELIDQGAMSVMVGHIALPSYQEHFSNQPVRQVLPATLSKEIVTNLLREQLSFNGLVVTDATPMVGFTSAMKREVAVPLSIEVGCDMFLFNKDLAEDIQFMKKGLENGIVSYKRIEEAVKRILAMKAALKLHQKKAENTLVPDESALEVLRQDDFVQKAREIADESVTLVKDTAHILPLSPQKTKKLLVEWIGPYEQSNQKIQDYIVPKLESLGFEVTVYQPENFGMKLDNVETFCAKYDAVLYFANVENRSNATTTRLNWHTFFGQGNHIPWFVNERPTVFVSLGNPYHLRDVPMVKTYINAYDNSEYIMDAVLDKLIGTSAFKGSSPVDPFCDVFGADF